MCGCNGGSGVSGAWSTNEAAAASGAWGTAPSRSDGPWLVQLPIYSQVNGNRKVTDFETVEVATYGEADALVRQRDPATGAIRGGGIRRKRVSAAGPSTHDTARDGTVAPRGCSRRHHDMVRRAVRRHFQRWGAVYILTLMFLASWIGQLIAQLPKVDEEGWSEFWSATLENWQSEFLQLAVQAVLVVGLASILFQVSKQDVSRIEGKLDELLERER
jgi:hypothetical protein